MASTVHLADGRSVLIVSARVKGRGRRDDVIAGEVGERMSFVFDEAVVGMAKVGLDGRVLQANRALGVQRRGRPDGIARRGPRRSGRPVASSDAGGGAHLGGRGHRLRRGRGAVRARRGSRARLHLTPVPDWLGVPMYLLVQVIG